MEKYKCPCCGNDTLMEEPPGTFEICPLCHWEDDNVQFDDPDYAGGANLLSLNAARGIWEQCRQESERLIWEDDELV